MTPTIAALYDVRTAVVILLVPNIVTNLSQVVVNRDAIRGVPALARFMVPALVAVAAGSLVLARVPPEWPTAALCVVILAYLGFRLLRPRWVMAPAIVAVIAAPAGLVAGFLHGVAGLSAPVSITYFSAMGLLRPSFSGAISCFFLVAGLAQIIVLGTGGATTASLMGLSVLACIPMMIGIAAGNLVARFIPERGFGIVVQFLLLLLAMKLLWDLIA